MLDTFGFVKALDGGKSPFRRRMGTVVSVQDYSLTVRIAGDTTTDVAGVRYFGHYAPKVGAQVWLDTDGTDLIAIGAVAGLGGAAPVARIYKNANQSVANANAELVTFSQVAFDPHGMFDNTNDQLVAPYAGVYLATATLGYNANGTGVRDVRIYQNGNTRAFHRQAAVSGLDSYISTSTLLSLAKGDTVQTWAYQSSGGALNVVTNGQVVSMTLQYVGPES